MIWKRAVEILKNWTLNKVEIQGLEYKRIATIFDFFYYLKNQLCSEILKYYIAGFFPPMSFLTSLLMAK